MLTRLGINGRKLWIFPLIVGIVVVLLPFLGAAPADLRLLMLVAILGLTVSGLNLAWGYGGELAVGMLAVYALGAYTTGWMVMQGYDLTLAILVSVIAAAALGFITSLPALRVSGWGVAMASFFLVIMIPEIIKLLPEQTGGSVGLIGIPAPVVFGVQLDSTQFYMLVMICTIIWFTLMRNAVVSRHGSALRVMRESPILTASLGMSTRKLKIKAYILGSIPAGLSGSLFAFTDRFISPDYFTFTAAILIIAASVLGGAETIYGALVGAAVITILPQRFGVFDQYAEVVFGAFLVIGGILLTSDRVKNGVDGLKLRIRNWGVVPETTPSVEAADIPDLPKRTLAVEDIHKSFGGNRALRGVSLEAKPGQITSLIGANGSGKTTLLNVISGFYKSDEGVVKLDGEELSLGRAPRIARSGIARTFQTPLVPSSMTVQEAVEVGRFVSDYASIGSTMLRLPNYRKVAQRDHDEAQTWLAATGLETHANQLARTLSLGDRRMLEVARALATGSSVLLLDEVASGLGPADLERLSRLLNALRDAGATIVLVEHNFQLVSELSDSIYVLERGELIAHGNAEEIRKDPAVARSYLGEEFEHAESTPTLTVPGGQHE